MPTNRSSDHPDHDSAEADQLDYFDAARMMAALRPREAVAAIRDALRAGLDPAATPPRANIDLAPQPGAVLVMPAASASAAGIKLATVAPGNPALGLPRVQGLYLLFSPGTLRPTAILDGAALTTLRTPAVSVAALAPFLAGRARPLRTLVFGAGPQAVGHVRTLRDTGIPLAEVSYAVRDPARVDRARLAGDRLIAVGASASLLPQADLVVCATTAATPLFDSALLQPDAVVVAIGSHEPTVREVDAALVGRAQVVVEDRATALRECGDVVLAVEERAVSADALIPLAEVVRGAVDLDPARPVLFKGSGMAWEDLVVAEAIYQRR